MTISIGFKINAFKNFKGSPEEWIFVKKNPGGGGNLNSEGVNLFH